MVLAYPKFGQKDYDWIQSLRAKHDLQNYDAVEPHATLVFPFEGLSEGELTNHVRAVVKKSPSFRLVLRSAMLIYNHFELCWHVFLTLDEGFGRLVKLHESLYTGILSENWLLKERLVR
jgi:2'-5' RNA ligase